MEKNYFLNMSYNLIWYVCLCIWICYYVILENIIVAYLNITWTINTLKWKGVLLSFFSPAADLFYFVTFLTVISPIAILFFIPNFFREDTPFFKRRYLLSILTVPLIFLLMFILLFIAWGSSPVIIDSDQKIRVRMIPFIPWPNHPFMDQR